MAKKDLIPQSFKDLTDKERKFMKLYVSDPTMSLTEIAYKCFNCNTDGSAAVLGSRLLRKVKIPIQEIMERMGVGIVNNIRKMKNLQEVKTTKFIPSKTSPTGYDEVELEDNTTQLKATELAFKVGGHLNQAKDFSNMGNTNIQINISEIKKDASLGDKIKQFGNMLSEANRGKS